MLSYLKQTLEHFKIRGDHSRVFLEQMPIPADLKRVGDITELRINVPSTIPSQEHNWLEKGVVQTLE